MSGVYQSLVYRDRCPQHYLYHTHLQIQNQALLKTIQNKIDHIVPHHATSAEVKSLRYLVKFCLVTLILSFLTHVLLCYPALDLFFRILCMP